MGMEVENLASDGHESVERCFVYHILYIYTSPVDWGLREDLNSWYFIRPLHLPIRIFRTNSLWYRFVRERRISHAQKTFCLDYSRF